MDASISDPNEAYITTRACETWELVSAFAKAAADRVQFCQEYDGMSVV